MWEINPPEPPPPLPPRQSAGWGGLLATLAIGGKLLLKFFPILLKTGGTMFVTMWIYATQWGWWFAAGFIVQLLIHECGHLVAARKHGLNVGAPVFIPFMGAFIALREAPKNVWVEFEVAAGGPIAGAMAAAVCHVIYLRTDIPIFGALAYIGYFLNLFNLMPVGFLDGGRMARAITPWLWVPGMGFGAWYAWHHPNPILILVLLLGIPRLLSVFRRKEDPDGGAKTLPVARRVQAAAIYFGLALLLAAAMHLVNVRMHP